MDSRRRVGLLFSISEGWIGGSYYFLNIIAALKTLPDDRQPVVIIYSSDNSGFIEAKKIEYPYLEYASSVFPYSFLERVVNRISRTVVGHNLIVHGLPETKMQWLFGYYEQLVLHKCAHKVFWIPDFQEHYYPEFIGKDATTHRKKLHRQLIRRKSAFVFSSNAAKNDFSTFYPTHKCQTSVVRFAVTHPDTQQIKFDDLKSKFNLPDNYFFVANQFWPHKNHMVILKALVNLRNTDVRIVFSGKMNREERHVRDMFSFIDSNDLQDKVMFLGFIDRLEQLGIMKFSTAVIQPSFFEGWSTVVEDAKAMGKQVILSDLPVHREQMPQAQFFKPQDESELAKKLHGFERNKSAGTDSSYSKNITQFASDFLEAIYKS